MSNSVADGVLASDLIEENAASLEEMSAARELYESLGFTSRTSYYETPLVHTVFMELGLYTVRGLR